MNTKKTKKRKRKCVQCKKVFIPYPDFRGGDIGRRICKKCSHHGDGNIERNNPKELKRYLKSVCPFHPLMTEGKDV
jgi:hypothetical protein